MSEKRTYAPEEIEELAAKAEKLARGHFRDGLNCGECVMLAYLELGVSDFPKETVALVSGMGGGIGFTHHMCGAVNAGVCAIGTRQGRKNPYEKETFEERVDQLHHDGTGIYPRHEAYVRDVVTEYGTMDCRDLCLPFDESTPEGKKARAKNCQQIIGFCARKATEAALKE